MATNPIRLWQARLRHRFSPRKIRLNSAGATLLEDGGSDALVCLVSRELCLFLTVDASKAPKKQRQDFLALAVRRAAPFPDPEYDVAWSPEGHAVVWYWSASRIRSLLGEHAQRRQKFVAEATYIGAVQDDAVELLELTEGTEGRIWRSGQLQNSRWWMGPPTNGQWQDFLRSAGLPTNGQLQPPSATSTTLAQAPWSVRALNVDSLKLAGVDRYLPKAALGCSILFLLVCGWQVGSIARAQLDIWRSASAVNSLDASLQRILDARSNADAATQEIETLLALRGPASTTSLMANIARLMPGTNWQVKRWNQPTPDTLELVLNAPEANPEQLVSLLEASPLLSSVTTDLDNNGELKIKASIEANSKPEASP